MTSLFSDLLSEHFPQCQEFFARCGPRDTCASGGGNRIWNGNFHRENGVLNDEIWGKWLQIMFSIGLTQFRKVLEDRSFSYACRLGLGGCGHFGLEILKEVARSSVKPTLMASPGTLNNLNRDVHGYLFLEVPAASKFLLQWTTWQWRVWGGCFGGSLQGLS